MFIWEIDVYVLTAALEGHMFGRILIFSGLTGKVLRWIPTPDRRESYYPPQILTRMDGEQVPKSLNDLICGSCFRVY